LLARLAVVAAAAALTAATQSAVTPRPILGGSFEASGAVEIAAGNGVLFVDDSRQDRIFWMPFNGAGDQIAGAVAIPLGVSINDPEGMTTDGRWIYVIGSQSKPKGPAGIGLVRFAFDAERRAVSAVQSITRIKTLLLGAVPTLGSMDPLRGDETFNIEGIAWDPGSKRLLLGLRAPVVNGHALIIPIGLRDETGTLDAANLRVEPAIEIPLSGAGIRGLEHDPRRQRFVIISGPSLDAERGDFRVLEWRPGNRTVRELARFPDELKPEGATSATFAAADALFLVFDTSRYALLRSGARTETAPRP
jgi:hypothetical protein